MKLKLKKIDAVIIVALIIIAGFVLLKIDIKPPIGEKETPNITFTVDEVNKKLIVESVSAEVLWSEIEILGSCTKSYLSTYVEEGDEITDCKGTITFIYKPNKEEIFSCKFAIKLKPPTSVVPGYEMVVSPQDEGAHYPDQFLVNREWWYYTVVFDEDSELAGWTATISFNHMALGDLFGTLKPDVLVVTLHSPDGKEYGGLINKRRGSGLLFPPALVATSPGVDVTYENSWAKGTAPRWTVHAEDKDIDGAHEIIMDLHYFAPGSPLWIHSGRELDKGSSKIADYVFMGCEVNGTVTLDGVEYNVDGIGHHEHSWSTGILRTAIKGWDWCHMTLDNGWNIYYSNYYLTRQITPTKTINLNPFATVIITTDQGDSFTKLEDVSIDITKSDKLFLLLKIPVVTNVTAEAKLLSQFLLKTYDVQINMNIVAENTYDHTWKLPSYIGMKIGRNTVTGSISWSDEDGVHSVDVNGIGTIWNMRH